MACGLRTDEDGTGETRTAEVAHVHREMRRLRVYRAGEGRTVEARARVLARLPPRATARAGASWVGRETAWALIRDVWVVCRRRRSWPLFIRCFAWYRNKTLRVLREPRASPDQSGADDDTRWTSEARPEGPSPSSARWASPSRATRTAKAPDRPPTATRWRSAMESTRRAPWGPLRRSTSPRTSTGPTHPGARWSPAATRDPRTALVGCVRTRALPTPRPSLAAKTLSKTNPDRRRRGPLRRPVAPRR
jgi:hypothetical protein